jgi:hypothetical protein
MFVLTTGFVTGGRYVFVGGGGWVVTGGRYVTGLKRKNTKI